MVRYLFAATLMALAFANAAVSAPSDTLARKAPANAKASKALSRTNALAGTIPPKTAESGSEGLTAPLQRGLGG